MKKAKRIMTSASALLVAASAGMGAFADGAAVAVDNPGESSTTKLNLTADATTFSVTVPAVLPLAFNSVSGATAPSNYQIINNSTGPVEVTGVKVVPGVWKVESYSSHNFSADPVNSGVLGLEFSVDGSSAKAATDGAANEMTLSEGWVINGGQAQTIKVDAKAAAVSADARQDNAAGVIFTIGWKRAEPGAMEKVNVAVELDTVLTEKGTTAVVTKDGDTATVAFSAATEAATGKGLLPSATAFAIMNPALASLASCTYTPNADFTSATLELGDPNEDIEDIKINLSSGYDLTVDFRDTSDESYIKNNNNGARWLYIDIHGNAFVEGRYGGDSGDQETYHNVIAIKPQEDSYVEVIDSKGNRHPLTDTDQYLLDGNADIGYYRVGSCLAYDTPITMADGSLKKMGELEVGDLVLSIDWDTRQLVARKVSYSGRDQEDYEDWYVNAYWENVFSDGTVIHEIMRHRFYNLESQALVHQKNWEMGNHAYKFDGTNPYLVSRILVQKRIRYARIHLEGDTNYFANGLLSGDCKSKAGVALTELLEQSA